jgi:hypothetical protein
MHAECAWVWAARQLANFLRNPYVLHVRNYDTYGSTSRYTRVFYVYMYLHVGTFLPTCTYTYLGRYMYLSVAEGL